MGTKVFGNPDEGNYIEVKSRISYMTKREMEIAERAAQVNRIGGAEFKNIRITEDPNIILLRAVIITLTENGITYKGNDITIEVLRNSVNNTENIEEAIEFLAEENRLGIWGELENLGIDELKTKKIFFEKAIALIDKKVELLGN